MSMSPVSWVSHRIPRWICRELWILQFTQLFEFLFFDGLGFDNKKQVCEFDGLGFEKKSVNFLITVFANCLWMLEWSMFDCCLAVFCFVKFVVFMKDWRPLGLFETHWKKMFWFWMLYRWQKTGFTVDN